MASERTGNWSEGSGHGFYTRDGQRAMQRCVNCGRENWAMAVLSGKCAWCPYDANEHADAIEAQEVSDAE